MVDDGEMKDQEEEMDDDGKCVLFLRLIFLFVLLLDITNLNLFLPSLNPFLHQPNDTTTNMSSNNNKK